MRIKKYQLENGKIPFDEWFKKLDKPVKAKVISRLNRMALGLYGEHRNLKNNIKELKFTNGTRIYFFEDGNEIILLLTAGNKQRQSNDIKQAEMYLEDYLERKI